MPQPPAQSGQSERKTVEQWEHQLESIDQQVTEQTQQLHTQLETGATVEEIQPLFASIAGLLTERYRSALQLLNDRAGQMPESIRVQQVDSLQSEYEERLLTLAAYVDETIARTNATY